MSRRSKPTRQSHSSDHGLEPGDEDTSGSNDEIYESLGEFLNLMGMDKPDAKGWSLLHRACAEGNEDIVEVLLKLGVDINASNNGTTPMHLAAKVGAVSVVALLLDRGADASIRNFDDGTPLLTAIVVGSRNVVELFLDRGTDPGHIDTEGSSLLHAAAFHGQAEVAALLLDRGAPTVAAVSIGGWSALHLAAGSGSVETVKVLLDHGADPNVDTPDGVTPCDMAISFGYDTVAELLIRHGGRTRHMFPTPPYTPPASTIEVDRVQEQLGEKLLETIRAQFLGMGMTSDYLETTEGKAAMLQALHRLMDNPH